MAMLSEDQEPIAKSARFRRSGYLLRRAIETAAQGKRLNTDERQELSDWLTGEEWWTRKPSRSSEEAKLARALNMLLGSDLRKALERASVDGQLAKDERKELRAWLDSAHQARWRYHLRRLLYDVGYGIILILIAVLVLKPGIRSLKDNPVWIPFLVALTILLAAWVKDVFFERSVQLALRHVEATTEKAVENLEAFMEINLEPRIKALSSREQIRRAASSIFDDAIKDTNESRFVVFMGAASLSTQKAGEAADLDDERVTSLDEYNNRLLQLETTKVDVRRYIALIREPDFQNRQAPTLREYSLWLDRQISLLKKNPEYILIDCPRAQSWGGSRSSIMTQNAVLDLIGDGESGLLVKGENIAQVLYKSSMKLLRTANQVTYRGGDKSALEQLTALKNQAEAAAARE